MFMLIILRCKDNNNNVNAKRLMKKNDEIVYFYRLTDNTSWSLCYYF